MASALLVTLLVTGGFAGIAAADEPSDPMDRIRLELGTTTEFGSGSYVAVNCTEGYNLAWFGVIYGTQGNPAPISIVGMNLRYLGGAEVVGPDGNVIVNEFPIPVITVFGQQMFALLEFDDTGIPTFFGETYGAGNGLFDFSTNKRMFEDDPFAKYEPAYKYIDLKQAWTLSDIKQGIDYETQTKTYDLSLYALNVTYTKVWDMALMDYRNGTPDDGVLERVEFAFHITASAERVDVSVPFYRVTLDNGRITDSEAIAPRNYTAVSTETAFKYDHIIEGWDFYENAKDPRLMLENGLIYAVFIPDKVEEWYNAQFVQDGVEEGEGVMEYSTLDGDKTAAEADDLPDEATLITKDRIQFKDNWQKTGALTWVSNVTVDGQENRSMVFQIHAGQRTDERGENDDGEVKAMFVLGGFIYPAGQTIFHDPALEMGAIALDIDPEMGGMIVLGIIGAIFVIGIVVVAVVVLRHNQKKKGNMRNQVPPPYRP